MFQSGQCLSLKLSLISWHDFHLLSCYLNFLGTVFIKFFTRILLYVNNKYNNYNNSNNLQFLWVCLPPTRIYMHTHTQTNCTAIFNIKFCCVPLVTSWQAV
jgi:hypothetical protein